MNQNEKGEVIEYLGEKVSEAKI